MMARRVRQYISIFFLCLFLAGVILVILANFLVTPERMRNVLVPVFENYLSCSVNMEGVAVSPLSGITLTNLELLNKADKRLLLAADKVTLRYQLWPLFQQRIVIDEIRMDYPRANVEYYADGTLNLDALLAKKKNNDLAAPEHREKNTSSKDVDLTITKFYVNKGELLFRDYRFAKAPHRYNLTDIDVNINNFALNHEFSIQLWGKINGAPVDVDGVVDLSRNSYDVKLNVANLDIVQFQPYYRNTFSGTISSLKLNIDSRIWGVGERLNAQGKANLRQLDFTLAPNLNNPWHVADFALEYNLNFDRALSDVKIIALTANCDGIVADLAGQLFFADAQPKMDLDVTLRKWDLRQVGAILPVQLAKSIRSYSVAGNVDVRLALRGAGLNFQNLFHDATVSLDAVQCSVGTMRPAISGVIKLNGYKLEADKLIMVLGDNMVDCQLSCQDWQAIRPDYHLRLHAEKFDSSAISLHNKQDVPSAINAKSDFKSYLPVLDNPVEPQALNLPFDVSGYLFVKQAIFGSNVVSNLRTNYELKNNLLAYGPLTGQFAGGNLNVHGQVDLTRQGFIYTGHVVVQKINLATFTPQIDTVYADTLSGTMDGAIDYSGAGTKRLRIQQNMAAKGNFNIVNGQMHGTELWNSVASLFNINSLQEFSFVQGKGDFSLKTGGYLSYSAQFLGSRVKVLPTGTALSDGTINADVDVFLAPELSAEIDPEAKFGAYIKDDQGWGYVPLKVSGKVAKPLVKVDSIKVKNNVHLRGTKKLLN
jgi:AsmA protein